MIQDLFPHQFYNEFSLKRDAQDNDEVFVFDGNNVLVSGDGENSPLSLPKASSFNQNELTYLLRLMIELIFYIQVRIAHILMVFLI